MNRHPNDRSARNRPLPTPHKDFHFDAPWYRLQNAGAVLEDWPMEAQQEADGNGTLVTRVRWVNGPHTGLEGRLLGYNVARTHLQVLTNAGVQWARETDVQLLTLVAQEAA